MHYDFDQVVDRSGTAAVKWEVHPDMLPLWVADMDLPCAQPVIEALHKRVDRRIFGYTQTFTPEYLQALLGWMDRRFGWQPKAEWARYTGGVVQALGCLVHLLSAPGDGIIIQRPVYGPFAMSIETQGRRVVDSPLKEVDGRFEMDFDDLAQKFADPQVVGMILCSPHNPVGRVWTAAELTRLLALARENGKWIVSDEIHCDILGAGVVHTPLLKLAGDWADHVYACTSVSKTFNLAGMQLSNIFIPNEGVRAAWDGYVCNTLHIGNVNPLSAAAMIAAYNEGEDWLAQANAYIDANLDFLRENLAHRLPKARMARREGTYLAWVDFSAYEADPEALRRRLQEQAKVLLNAGSDFGGSGCWQRINAACPRSLLREALDRMVAVLAG